MSMFVYLIQIYTLILATYAESDLFSSISRTSNISEVCFNPIGCFSTSPPFFHPVARPISLAPQRCNVTYKLFTPAQPDVAYDLEHNLASLQDSPFDETLPTLIFISGYLSTYDYYSEIFETWKDKIYRLKQYNVIFPMVFDCLGFPYEQAVANARTLGAWLAELISIITKNTGASTESFHLVGFSLGAEIASYAGKQIKNLGRITALDPPGQYFDNMADAVVLTHDDALFVDTIHTSVFPLEGFGTFQPNGDQSFIVNGGISQPGCSNHTDLVKTPAIGDNVFDFVNCRHRRALQLFNESIEDTGCRFWAVQCDSLGSFRKGDCTANNSVVAEMGFHAKPIDVPPKSKFFLTTRGKQPYCRKHPRYL